ncbi:MAG TPA: zinc ribbon domain-containing protein [Trebonia sp.]
MTARSPGFHAVTRGRTVRATPLRDRSRTGFARDSRESQALFPCTACGHTANADVNAALNIAAGHAVKARGADRDAGAVNREPQLDLLAS